MGYISWYTRNITRSFQRVLLNKVKNTISPKTCCVEIWQITNLVYSCAHAYLSGSNFNGSGQYLSSLWMSKVGAMMQVPALYLMPLYSKFFLASRVVNLPRGLIWIHQIHWNINIRNILWNVFHFEYYFVRYIGIVRKDSWAVARVERKRFLAIHLLTAKCLKESFSQTFSFLVRISIFKRNWFAQSSLSSVNKQRLKYLKEDYQRRPF